MWEKEKARETKVFCMVGSAFLLFSITGKMLSPGSSRDFFFKFTTMSSSGKGSDGQCDTPLVTIENLASFVMKLQRDLNEVNDKFEHRFDRLQRNLKDRNLDCIFIATSLHTTIAR